MLCEKCHHEHGEGTTCQCGCATGGEMKTCKMCATPMDAGHTKRCMTHVCAKLLWLLGVAALLSAWYADSRDTTVLGFSSNHLFHDAIAFLVLAVSLKMKKRGHGYCCK